MQNYTLDFIILRIVVDHQSVIRSKIYFKENTNKRCHSIQYINNMSYSLTYVLTSSTLSLPSRPINKQISQKTTLQEHKSDVNDISIFENNTTRNGI